MAMSKAERARRRVRTCEERLKSCNTAAMASGATTAAASFAAPFAEAKIKKRIGKKKRISLDGVLTLGGALLLAAMPPKYVPVHVKVIGVPTLAAYGAGSIAHAWGKGK